MDYGATLYGPVWTVFAVAAHVDLGSQGEFDIKVIDKTAGVPVAEAGDASIQRIVPAAAMKATDLVALDVSVADLDDGTLTMNGKDWIMTSHALVPAPTGEERGEVWVYLEAM